MTIDSVTARAFRVPTDGPEADGTFAWTATTVVVAEVGAGGRRGVGYSYTAAAAARLIEDMLAPVVAGRDPLAVRGCWDAMLRAVRNIGLEGLAASAISAVDAALWDLKAKILGLPLVRLLGQVRPRIAIYGSGGFTSYAPATLESQLEGWAAMGIRAVKMKVGSHPEQDAQRVAEVRRAIGAGVALYVDGNGAYDRPQALALADAFAGQQVTWFEEPVSSDDLADLALVRRAAPPGMAIAAGEYGYNPWYFRRMLEAQAVDVLQADATRCLGLTGFLLAGALCEAFNTPMSAHCAPALHLHAACALPAMRNIEWFHDHRRIEAMLFDGVVAPVAGALEPDAGRPGLGIALKDADAARWAV